MKLLKVILSIIVSFSLLWILVALFSPKTIGVSESIVIEQSSAEVFAQVNNLEKWEYWADWDKRDSLMTRKFSSNSVGENASVSWISESEGNGSQKIIESTPFEKIRFMVSMSEMGDSYATWTFDEIEDFKTKVTWIFEDKEIGFLLRPLVFSFNNSISEDFTNGLSNLKNYVENLPQQNKKLVPTVIEAEAFSYVSKHVSCEFDNIGPEMGKAYAELMKLCSKNSWSIEGMPISIKTESDSEMYEFDVAFKLDRLVNAPSGFSSGQIAGGKTLMMSHFGLYENLPASYEVMDNWMKVNGYELASKPYEIYVTDPGEEPDSSKWETQIFYPISKIES